MSDTLEKTSRRKLLQLAIGDAKTNASTIALALEIKLGKVKQVQKSAYGLLTEKLEEVKLAVPKIAGETNIQYKTSFDKFEIEDIELEERITVIYTIATS